MKRFGKTRCVGDIFLISLSKYRQVRRSTGWSFTMRRFWYESEAQHMVIFHLFQVYLASAGYNVFIAGVFSSSCTRLIHMDHFPTVALSTALIAQNSPLSSNPLQIFDSLQRSCYFSRNRTLLAYFSFTVFFAFPMSRGRTVQYYFRILMWFSITKGYFCSKSITFV